MKREKKHRFFRWLILLMAAVVVLYLLKLIWVFTIDFIRYSHSSPKTAHQQQEKQTAISLPLFTQSEKQLPPPAKTTIIPINQNKPLHHNNKNKALFDFYTLRPKLLAHTLTNNTTQQPSTTYFLSIAKLQDKKAAQVLKIRLNFLGYFAQIHSTKIHGTLWYQVILGPYNKKSEARRIQKTLTITGSQPLINVKLDHSHRSM